MSGLRTGSPAFSISSTFSAPRRALKPLQPNPDFAGARVEFVESGVLRTDYVLSGSGPKTGVRLPDGLEFAGQFGVASEDRLFLVNGTKLRFGGYSLEAKPVPAKITGVNAATNEITLDVLLPAGALSGKVVTISNSLHSTSYTIHSAANQEGRTVLNFGDVLPIIAEGHVVGVDSAKSRITTDTVLTGHARVDSGKHEGRWLTDSKRTFALKIKRFDGTTFVLDGKIPEGAFADRRFFIVDFGIGDKAEVPSIQSVHRDGAGQYHLQSTTPFRVTVPAISGAYALQQGDAWVPVEAKIVGGKLTIRIDPSVYTDGKTILKRTE
jgi:hypothetical protein